MKQTACFALIFLTVSFSVSAEIYRCELEGVVTFSDTACQPDARPYRVSSSISVVSAPEDLDRTRQLNQAFIRERLDRQTARYEARAARPAATVSAPVTRPAPFIAIPYYGPDRWADSGHRGPMQRRPGNRPEQLDQAPGLQRFSALGGPFPGTRRDREQRP